MKVISTLLFRYIVVVIVVVWTSVFSNIERFLNLYSYSDRFWCGRAFTLVILVILVCPGSRFYYFLNCNKNGKTQSWMKLTAKHSNSVCLCIALSLLDILYSCYICNHRVVINAVVLIAVVGPLHCGQALGGCVSIKNYWRLVVCINWFELIFCWVCCYSRLINVTYAMYRVWTFWSRRRLTSWCWTWMAQRTSVSFVFSWGH